MMTGTRSMSTTEIYFIRHAQSRPSKDRHHAEWPLSKLGKLQAERLIPILSALHVDRVYSSPYVRCLDTIGPWCQRHGVAIEIDEGLRERLVAHGLIENFAAVWERSWIDFDFALDDCETSRQAQVRFVGAVTGLTRGNVGRRIAISSHGNVLGLLLNHIDASSGRAACEALRNPEMLRMHWVDEGFHWDRGYKCDALEEFATGFTDSQLDE